MARGNRNKPATAPKNKAEETPNPAEQPKDQQAQGPTEQPKDQQAQGPAEQTKDQQLQDSNQGKKGAESKKEKSAEEIVKEFFAPYLDAYPNENEFYATSDGQVFLKAHKQDAAAHQRTLDKDIELAVYCR